MSGQFVFASVLSCFFVLVACMPGPWEPFFSFAAMFGFVAIWHAIDDSRKGKEN